MDCVIIGVSDRSVLWRHGKIKEKEYAAFVNEYAKFLASRFDNVIVTPDDGVYTDVALQFGVFKGRKPIGYYPSKDTFYGIKHIEQNFPKYHLRDSCGDWYKVDADLTKQAPVVICMGFAPGSLIEAMFVKYHQTFGASKDASLARIKLLVDARCISGRLPSEIEEQVDNLHYFSSLDQLDKLLG